MTVGITSFLRQARHNTVRALTLSTNHQQEIHHERVNSSYPIHTHQLREKTRFADKLLRMFFKRERGREPTILVSGRAKENDCNVLSAISFGRFVYVDAQFAHHLAIQQNIIWTDSIKDNSSRLKVKVKLLVLGILSRIFVDGVKGSGLDHDAEVFQICWFETQPQRWSSQEIFAPFQWNHFPSNVRFVCWCASHLALESTFFVRAFPRPDYPVTIWPEPKLLQRQMNGTQHFDQFLFTNRHLCGTLVYQQETQSIWCAAVLSSYRATWNIHCFSKFCGRRPSTAVAQ